MATRLLFGVFDCAIADPRRYEAGGEAQDVAEKEEQADAGVQGRLRAALSKVT
jgi:hypothetical protein